MTLECPSCLRPLPPIDRTAPAPRTDGEAMMLTLIADDTVTPRCIAQRLLDDDTRASVERVRRRMDALTREGLLERVDRRDGSTAALYRRARPRPV